jgi:membrane associated rhomboid family serine protease
MVFPIKAKWFVIIFGALELYFGLHHRADDNTGYLGHFGGLVIGIILILIWRKNRQEFY